VVYTEAVAGEREKGEGCGESQWFRQLPLGGKMGIFEECLPKCGGEFRVAIRSYYALKAVVAIDIVKKHASELEFV
jgi:hypothetical protein